VSLQYYPHHDLELKPPARSERTVSGAGDYVAVAIINAILAMALVSFISSGGVVGTLVVLGLIAGFNVLALSGRG
jgi:hypothetical protein